MVLGYSLLWAYVAEHIQLLLVFSTHASFLSGCAVETREFRGTPSASNRVFPQPARAIVSEFCREFGWFVDGEIVSTTATPESEKILSEIETKMVAVLRQHGPVLYRTEFQELCAAKGISRNTSSMYLGANPL